MLLLRKALWFLCEALCSYPISYISRWKPIASAWLPHKEQRVQMLAGSFVGFFPFFFQALNLRKGEAGPLVLERGGVGETITVLPICSRSKK